MAKRLSLYSLSRGVIRVTLPPRLPSTTALPRARWLSTSSSTAKRAGWSRLKIFCGGTVAGCGVLQYFYGFKDDFYDYRFITKKDPDDLAGFYGSEDFMEIFCVLPFMGTLMMRGGEFDDEGTVHTTGWPGEMLVSMVFSDKEEDTTGDGEPDTTTWFNKRERFKDQLYGFKMWDQVSNFGFRRLPDGTCEVYHHGEYFHGYSPPLSLIVRFVFQVHARWVAWATEHYLNHCYAFTASTDEEETIAEDSKADMPLHLLRTHVWPDFKAIYSGERKEKDSFLVGKEPPSAMKRERNLAEQHMEQIKNDIAADRAHAANRTLPTAEPQGSGDVGSSKIAIMNDPEALVLAEQAAKKRMLSRKISRKATETLTLATEAAKQRQVSRKVTLRQQTAPSQ